MEMLHPTSGNVLIAPIDREPVSKFIIDPELHKLESYRGTILAVSPDAEFKEEIRPGQDVIFAPYSHRSLDLHGSVLFVVHWSDILARVE